jgi:L-alanine-DL-glutamate epimerase-like enolase superfamily enzyme
MDQSLIIQKIEIYRFEIPLKEPFVTSLGTDHSAANVLVRIHTIGGLTGFGECSPYMPIHGESVETCCLVGRYLASAIQGMNALGIEEITHRMDEVIYGNSSIKSAFDMALYDIAAQNAGQPLYAYLGGMNDRVITTDYTVSIGEPASMAKEARRIMDAGFPAIKVKLGKNGKTDVERIAGIRKAVGDSIPLRIDANQGWSKEEAIETLKALAPFNIEHCEEPIPRWDFMNLPEVKRQSPIPVMADESCGDHHDAERLIAINACDYFNIKLGKSGGIFKALKIVALAEKAGLHLQVGAFLESRLAMTAFAHFALCSRNICHYDFDTALMFSEDPVSGGIVYEANGVVRVPDEPGLGATVSEDRLKKMTRVL